MKHLFSSCLLLSALALASIVPAHAQLLAGSSRGEFTGPTGSFIWINNGPVVSSFTTGWPLPSQITFTGDTFAGVGDGDTFDLGLVKVKNGITLFDTAAADATMDLFLTLPDYGVSDFKLTTLLFEITHSTNFPGLVADLYYIGYTAPALLNIGGNIVSFDLGFTDPDFNLPPGEAIHELHKENVGLYATVAFTPVPEPSTYAAFAALGLMGLVAAKRYRRRAAG